MDDFQKHVYIVGPNKELNEKFLGSMFGEEYKFAPNLFRVSTNMMDPDGPHDAIQIYVVLDDNEDWLMHYTTKSLFNTTLVKDF